MLTKKLIPLLLVLCIFATACNAESSYIVSENIANKVDVIFIDNVKYLNNYSETEFVLNSENAMSNLVDLLVEHEKWQDDLKLMCSAMTSLNEVSYYQITVSTENDFSYSDVGTFWVDADSGTTYLKFDPTLDSKGYFSEFATDIPEDDYRTRLILIS